MDKVANKKIGVIDMGLGGLPILNNLKNVFKNDDIFYITDLTITNYDNIDIDFLNILVKKNIDLLLEKNIDLLLVISDTIVEYCMELVNSYSIPIIQIVEETIDYVNEQFEYKNLAFMACNNMIEANIYQKNFRYNHLYTLVADDMDKLLYEGKTKTSESFAQTRACLLATAKKDIDVIIPSKIHFLLLKTEIYEFLKNVIVVPIDEVLTTKVIESLYKKNPLPQKGKGKVIIHINKSISDKVLSKYLNIKYKIILEEGGKEYGKK